MEINKKVPSFKLLGTSDLQFNLSDYKGRYLVIYFYPKDATPGCTTQGVDFRDAYKKFQALDTEIFGISRDTLKSHENFKEKFTFPFELLSDDEDLQQKRDQIEEKINESLDMFKRFKKYN